MNRAQQRIDLASRLVANPQQVSCEIEEETVILSLRTGEYYGLNTVAARIWELVQEERGVAEIRDALLHTYDIDEATCTAQTLAILQDMLALELVELRPAP